MVGSRVESFTNADIMAFAVTIKIMNGSDEWFFCLLYLQFLVGNSEIHFNLLPLIILIMTCFTKQIVSIISLITQRLISFRVFSANRLRQSLSTSSKRCIAEIPNNHTQLA